MGNKYYIYIYFDQRKPGRYIYNEYQFDYEPFYIGKGSGRRMLVHLSNSESKKGNMVKHLRILSIRQQIGDKPLAIKLAQNLSEEEAFSLERKLIKCIGRLDLEQGPLTNKNDGGGGGRNSANLSKESRKKLGDFTRGKTYEEIHGHEKAVVLRAAIGENNKNRIVSQTAKDKMSAKWGMTWEIVSPDGKVLIINSLNKFCKKNSLTLTLMHHVAIGKQKHHKGWKCKRV